MKKIIVIADSFKGTMTSKEVCDIECGTLEKALPQCNVVNLPVADGGEGTVDCFLNAMDGEKISVTVKDAFWNETEGFYGRFKDLAVVEMAAVAGIVSNSTRDPLNATTYGVGQLVNHAIESGCRRILIGLGGSCTNDAGAGMAAAIGTRFYNEKGDEFVPTGGNLSEVVRIDNSKADEKLSGIKLSCMCDIDNHLYGKEGAAYKFARQKGASSHDIRLLDSNLFAFAKTIKREFGIDVANLPGGGAAGGMGAGAFAMLGAGIQSGIDYILDLIRFDEFLHDCDLVITGEGRLDDQSLDGKVIDGVLRRTRKNDVPTIAIVGALSEEFDSRAGMEKLAKLGIKKVYATAKTGAALEEIKKTCKIDLENTVMKVVRDLQQG